MHCRIVHLTPTNPLQRNGWQFPATLIIPSSSSLLVRCLRLINEWTRGWLSSLAFSSFLPREHISSAPSFLLTTSSSILSISSTSSASHLSTPRLVPIDSLSLLSYSSHFRDNLLSLRLPSGCYKDQHGYCQSKGTLCCPLERHGLTLPIQEPEESTDLLVDDVSSIEPPVTGSWECPGTYQPKSYEPFLKHIADLTGTRVTYDGLGDKVDVLGKNATIVEQTIDRLVHLHSALV